jgi:hypothetical protein
MKNKMKNKITHVPHINMQYHGAPHCFVGIQIPEGHNKCHRARFNLQTIRNH